MAEARRRRRRGLLAAALLLPYPAALLCGMPAALPFDAVLTLGGVAYDAALHAPQDGRRHLVVLQHGLWRSPWSMARLERALRAHGYDVLNPGYPSTSCTIEEAASMLAAAIDAECAAGPRPVELSFVAHSMGGLVVQEYLRRPDARPFARAVYIAVPHRGAVLCDLRKHWWPFPLLLGTGAALQLSPGDPFHRRAIPHPERCGAIVGDVGDGNAAIPGRDDGTVAVGEAQLGGAADTVVVPLGHTAIAGSAVTARQVLEFLARGRFAAR
ncbi:MAG: esterase/lipase family protein [Planctomycetota bacterium]